MEAEEGNFQDQQGDGLDGAELRDEDLEEEPQPKQKWARTYLL